MEIEFVPTRDIGRELTFWDGEQVVERQRSKAATPARRKGNPGAFLHTALEGPQFRTVLVKSERTPNEEELASVGEGQVLVPVSVM